MSNFRPWLFLCIHLMSGLICAVSVAAEQGGFSEPLLVSNARQPETPLQVMPKAGYLALHNQSHETLIITAISSPAFEKVELHKAQLVDGLASMVLLDELIVAAGETIHLEPGGLHLMMFNVRNEYAVDDVYQMTLHFSNQTAQSFDMRVVKSMSKGLARADASHHHEHHKHHE